MRSVSTQEIPAFITGLQKRSRQEVGVKEMLRKVGEIKRERGKLSSKSERVQSFVVMAEMHASVPGCVVCSAATRLRRCYNSERKKCRSE